MSFQAYINNIKVKTGKTPDDFKAIATEKGFLENGVLKPSTKPTDIIQWLKDDFALGHGHAMAIYAVFKNHKEAIGIDGNSPSMDKKT
jgi:hypothetical protein